MVPAFWRNLEAFPTEHLLRVPQHLDTGKVDVGRYWASLAGGDSAQIGD